VSETCDSWPEFVHLMQVPRVWMSGLSYVSAGYFDYGSVSREKDQSLGLAAGPLRR